MSGFVPGGIVGGPSKVRMVPETHPAVDGEPFVIYADECIVATDGLCRRSDAWHRAAQITTDRPWICLAHD